MQHNELSNNKLIIYIRRGPLELEWISPILEKFYDSKYDIYFYFKSKTAFNNVKNETKNSNIV